MQGLELQPRDVSFERAVGAAAGPETESIADLLEAGRHVDGIDQLLVGPTLGSRHEGSLTRGCCSEPASPSPGVCVTTFAFDDGCGDKARGWWGMMGGCGRSGSPRRWRRSPWRGSRP